MKYSKIIKENFQSKFTYIFTIIFSCLLFVLLSFGGTKLNLIVTWFSGGADINENDYRVTYYSNMPEGVFCAIEFKMFGAQFFYEVRDNEFGVPNGYEFVGWNTNADGSGTSYKKGSIVLLEADFTLYAQWKSLLDDGDNAFENDDDLNSPDNDDVVGDNENTEDDSNKDSENVDRPDGSLNEDTSNSDGNQNNDNSINGEVGHGTGNGGTGSGNGSLSGSGNSSTDNYENSNPPTNNSSVNNSNNNSSINDNIFKDEDREESKIYKFSFFNNNMLFSMTSCEVLEDNTCMLVLPANTPNVEGRNFLGWSTNSSCNLEVINESLKVNSNKEYYACYDDYLEENNNSIIYLIVSIWCVAGILIYFIIRKYKKNNINKNND